jgi:hypothetical protein
VLLVDGRLVCARCSRRYPLGSLVPGTDPDEIVEARQWTGKRRPATWRRH